MHSRHTGNDGEKIRLGRTPPEARRVVICRGLENATKDSRGILTCWICRLRELHKRPQPQTTDDGNDEANTKHGHDLKLLLAGHVEFGQHRQRQTQNDQVQEDFDRASDETEQSYIDTAVTRHFTSPTVPEKGDRGALEDHGEDIADAKPGNHTDENPDYNTQLLIDHDSQVEGKDGQLA